MLCFILIWVWVYAYIDFSNISFPAISISLYIIFQAYTWSPTSLITVFFHSHLFRFITEIHNFWIILWICVILLSCVVSPNIFSPMLNLIGFSCMFNHSQSKCFCTRTHSWNWEELWCVVNNTHLLDLDYIFTKWRNTRYLIQ